MLEQRLRDYLDKKHLDRYYNVWLLFKSIKSVSRDQLKDTEIRGVFKIDSRKEDNH